VVRLGSIGQKRIVSGVEVENLDSRLLLLLIGISLRLYSDF
jgi:hypothetical protein